MKWFSQMPLELTFWVMAIVLLATAEPVTHHDANHLTLCPVALLGLDWCPGCGIGRGITQVLHGNITESWNHHKLAIPALLVIACRVVDLSGFRRNHLNIISGGKKHV
ncbi:DUF2752 domain-containing protein [Pedobacter deserti]|uniref:DUF2752 domain-containing protein n=1 Tax=Pedobacter deserti TaxID=2817382 RepID=UPI0021098373|nr:DUF2752 domain-containing protein [Pedobacter sp. SYSU D00382]